MTYLYGYIKYHYIYIIPIISFKSLLPTKKHQLKIVRLLFLHPRITSIPKTKQELYDLHPYAHLKVLHQIVLHYLH